MMYGDAFFCFYKIILLAKNKAPRYEALKIKCLLINIIRGLNIVRTHNPLHHHQFLPTTTDHLFCLSAL